MNPITPVLEALARGRRQLRNLVVEQLPVPAFVSLEITGRLPERRAAMRGWQQWLGRRLSGRQPSLEEWRERLHELAFDPRIKGIVLKISQLQAGLGALESLRTALETFRASGKRVVAYVPTLTLHTYYLTSVADLIVVPESGELALHGLRTEAMFLREALDRLGILPQFHHIGEYKSAVNRFLYPAMPDAEREMLASLLDRIFEEITTTIAQARQLPLEAVRGAVDRGLLSAGQARADRLIDAVAFEDQLATLCANGGPAVDIRPWTRVRRRIRRPLPRRSSPRQMIGVVPLVGAITLGESREFPIPLPLFGQQLAGYETIARMFRLAEELPHVKAIIFHVDSPGGSAVASDLIWREVIRVQQKKPVVVQMGNVAGSGGYYVACGARHIIAGATTLTGSIGVVAGKFDASGLYARGGIRREIMTRGETAAMPSAFTPYSEAEWDLLRTWMQEIYHRFKERVAAGRWRSLEEVETLARGRVWTGRQALEHGLIDEIGDFQAAIRKAKTLAGISPEADIPVMTLHDPEAVALPKAPLGVWEDALSALGSLLAEQALTLMPGDSLV